MRGHAIVSQEKGKIVLGTSVAGSPIVALWGKGAGDIVEFTLKKIETKRGHASQIEYNPVNILESIEKGIKSIFRKKA